MPRNPQGIYSLPAGNPVVSGTLIESTWANPTMSDIAAALTGSVPRDGTAGMQAQLLLVDQVANPPTGGQMAISVDYLTGVLENYQSGAQGGAGNPIIFENDRIATVDYTIQNGKNGMTAGPFAINGGVTIGVPAGSRWSIVGGGTTDGPPVALGDTFPLMDGTSAPGTGTFASRNDHVHPSDTSRAPLNSPALTGVPTAPTASLGNNSTQIATTAFVIANAGSGGGGGTPSDALPLMDGVASCRRGDRVQPGRPRPPVADRLRADQQPGVHRQPAGTDADRRRQRHDHRHHGVRRQCGERRRWSAAVEQRPADGRHCRPRYRRFRQPG